MKYYYSGADIQKGSRGDDVSSWQKYLKEQGYYKGAINGNFDGFLDAATRAYQTDNNLTVDGLVGSQTWGNAGFVNYNDLGVAPDYETDYYMGSYLDTAEGKKKNEAVGTALDNLDAYGSFDFKYDVNEDALYQQAVERYKQMGKLAMEDTMGQASALTGGYGNSYAATVGNQAYQSYMQEASDALPEYYQRALDEYTDKYSTEYNRLKGIYDRAVSDLDTGEQMHRDAQADKNTAYAKAVDEHDADVAEKTKAKKEAEALTKDEIKILQEAVGVEDPDGIWGDVSTAKSGGLTLDEAYDAWINGDLKEVTDADRVDKFDETKYEENMAAAGGREYVMAYIESNVFDMAKSGEFDNIVSMLIDQIENSNLSVDDADEIIDSIPEHMGYERIYNMFHHAIEYRKPVKKTIDRPLTTEDKIKITNTKDAAKDFVKDALKDVFTSAFSYTVPYSFS